MRELPYRAKRCPDCTSDDADCQTCGGCHRVIERVKDLQTVRDIMKNYIAKARAYRAAWGHK